MTDTDTDGIEQFREGDRVRHIGEGIEGEVSNAQFPSPKFKVEWEDGVETIESFHTVLRLSDNDRSK